MEITTSLLHLHKIEIKMYREQLHNNNTTSNSKMMVHGATAINIQMLMQDIQDKMQTNIMVHNQINIIRVRHSRISNSTMMDNNSSMM